MKVRAVDARRHAVGAVLIGVILLGCAPTEPTVPVRSNGLLRASDSEPRLRTVVPKPGVDAYSFGSIFLCLPPEAPEEALLVSVEPIARIGTGFETAGVGVHQTDPSLGGEALELEPGYPPKSIDVLEDVADEGSNFSVSAPCPAAPEVETVQLIIGLGVVGEGGGGWDGIRVRYTLAEKPYVLEIPQTLIVCGSETADLCQPD